MGLLKRFLDWRSERREDRAAIAEASSELRRVGDEPVESQSETVNAAFEQLPPMP
jgi:hypothetical protein